MPFMAGYLKAIIDERGGNVRAEQIPESVVIIIVQEAYRRAAEKESDKRARLGMFYRELEMAADNIIKAFQGKPQSDSRIRDILVFNRLI
jgi:hypothetical protein